MNRYIRFLFAKYRIIVKRLRAILVYMETGCWLNYVDEGCELRLLPQYLKYGKNVKVPKFCRLSTHYDYAGVDYTPQLTIGDNVCLGWMNHITCVNKITIGHDVLFGSKVYVGDNSHGFYHGRHDIDKAYLDTPPAKRELGDLFPIDIGPNCWIGDNAVILAGANIGKGCIVAANSVVLKGDYPDYSVIAGAPAKVVKVMVDEGKKV